MYCYFCKGFDTETEYGVYYQTNEEECKNLTSGVLSEQNSTMKVLADCIWNATIEARNCLGETNSQVMISESVQLSVSIRHSTDMGIACTYMYVH